MVIYGSAYRTGLRMRRVLGVPIPKTFCIGFNKTGTTSIHAVFHEIGFRSYHGLAWHESGNAEVYDRFECFSDGFPPDWRVLDTRYPDARFVLNVRDCRGWILSRLKHIARSRERGVFGEGRPEEDWIDTEDAVARWITAFHRHHREVLDHFADRPGKLLVVNFVADPGAADKLAAYLGATIRAKKPHANRSRRPPAPEHERMLRAACARHGLEPADLATDLLIEAWC